MAKGSALSRAIKFFEEGDIHEAQFALQRGVEIVKARGAAKEGKAAGAAKRPKPARKSHHKARTNSAAAHQEDPIEVGERQMNDLSN